MSIRKLIKKILKPEKSFKQWAEEQGIDLKQCTPQRTCCFTGHRNIKMNEKELQGKLANLMAKAVDDGYTNFICGGAIGFDMIAAEQICSLKKLNKNMSLEIAVPFKEQDKLYSKADKNRYALVMKKANKTTILSENYHKFCYDVWNKYIENSTLVIAYFDGSRSGTKNTIDYAKKQNKEICYV